MKPNEKMEHMIEKLAERQAKLMESEAPRFRNMLKQSLDLARKNDPGIEAIIAGMGRVALRGEYITVSGEVPGRCDDYACWRRVCEEDQPKFQETRDFFDLLAAYDNGYPHEVPEVGYIT
jgi:hypothetical protein